jgi:hypothetical protein
MSHYYMLYTRTLKYGFLGMELVKSIHMENYSGHVS